MSPPVWKKASQAITTAQTSDDPIERKEKTASTPRKALLKTMIKQSACFSPLGG
jgi:hypothetical protein